MAISCPTPELRQLWDEHMSELEPWTEGSICQATLLELWSFGQICILDAADFPKWPPEIADQLSEYARMLQEYMENMRRAKRE